VSQSPTSAGFQFTADDYRFALMAVEEARKSVGEDGRTHPKLAPLLSPASGSCLGHRGKSPVATQSISLSNTSCAITDCWRDRLYHPGTMHRKKPSQDPLRHRLVERKVKRVVLGSLDPNPVIRDMAAHIARSEHHYRFFRRFDGESGGMNRDFTRSHRREG